MSCSPGTRCAPSSAISCGTSRSPRWSPRSAARSGRGSINRATVGLYDRWRDRDDRAVHHVTGPRNLDACATELAALRKDGDILDYELVGYEADMPGLLAARDGRGLPGGRGHGRRAHRRGSARGARPAARRAERSPGAQREHARPMRVRQWSSPTPTATRRGSTRSSRNCSPRPDRLAGMAAAARRLARPDAAARLADLVEEHARL